MHIQNDIQLAIGKFLNCMTLPLQYRCKQTNIYGGSDEKIISLLETSGYKDNLTNEERITFFKNIARSISVISLRDGFAANPKLSKRFKAPLFETWQQYCQKKNPSPPQSSHRIGWTTGPCNGLLVLDIDDEQKFQQHLNETEKQLPGTFTVKTGKGRHLYFRYPEDGKRYGNRSFKDKGYDLRGDGGYVLGVGSLHPETRQQYTVSKNSEIADAPDWLKTEAAKEDVPPTVPTPPLPQTNQTEAIFAPVPVGQRSEESMKCLESLMRKGFTDDQIIAIWETLPIGEKARERGPEWFKGELARARAFLEANNNKSPNKKKSFDTVKELMTILDSLEYYVHNSEFYAKDSSGTNVIYISIHDDEFTGLVSNAFFEKTGSLPSLQSIKSAVSTLKYRLKKNGAKPIDKMTRFGTVADSLILDLGNDKYDCIEITNSGYKRISQPEILLERNENILPIDVRLGCNGIENFMKLMDILNIDDDDERLYILITVVSYIFDKISTPALFFYGPEGSSKSFRAKSIKNIFDPAKSGTSLNKNISDLVLFLSKSGIGFIDNFSDLSVDCQNNFCLAHTDGTYVKRMMYENSKTCSFQLKCPMIFTSVYISTKMNRDFISRTAFFKVYRPENIIAEEDLIKDIEPLYPSIRGEMCWLASEVMNLKDNYTATNQKRHGDFDKIGQAVCKIIYDNPDLYRNLIERRILADNISIIENDAVIYAFIQLVKTKSVFYFTMSSLKAELEAISDDSAVSSIQPNKLSLKLHKYKNILETCGIYLLDGTKTSTGHIYMACTKEYADSGCLEVDVDFLKENPEYVYKLYTDYNDDLINITVNNFLN